MIHVNQNCLFELNEIRDFSSEGGDMLEVVFRNNISGKKVVLLKESVARRDEIKSIAHIIRGV